MKTRVERGEFRSDLYFRLNVFPINIPPLRERIDDIPPLVLHFLERFNRKFGKHITKISSRGMEGLMDYPFPGNVRELEHIIERAVILSDDKSLVLPEIKENVLPSALITQRQPLKEHERLYIVDTLEQCKWRVSGPHGAARILDVNQQLYLPK